MALPEWVCEGVALGERDSEPEAHAVPLPLLVRESDGEPHDDTVALQELEADMSGVAESENDTEVVPDVVEDALRVTEALALEVLEEVAFKEAEAELHSEFEGEPLLPSDAVRLPLLQGVGAEERDGAALEEAHPLTEGEFEAD